MADYLIIARSGRALAASANRAGYKVCVADCFTDEDTISFSESVFQLQYNNDGFVEEELLCHAREIISQYPNIKLVPGSGIEFKPELISKLSELAPVVCNNKESILAVKEPHVFFKMLKKNTIAYPDVSFNKPDSLKGYLIKKNMGIGGVHVNWAEQINFEFDSDYYFQKYVSGVVYSVLFLANGTKANLVGFNQQFQSNEFTDMPFLYQGAVSLSQKSVGQKEIVKNIVNTIVKETGLMGLCGIDYIVNESGKVVVLEVNPRPPATFELHETQRSLFAAHIACFTGNLIDYNQDRNKLLYRAYAILYAKENCFISDKVEWSDWVKDRPQAGKRIPIKFPVCTVHARENSLDKVKAMLFNRLHQVETMIAATQNSV